jgi:hypothetical protein
MEGTCPTQAQVIAVHRDVESAHRDGHALDVGHPRRDAAGEGDPSGLDAQEHEVMGAMGTLEDLVRDATEDAGDVIRAQDAGTGPIRDGAVALPEAGHIGSRHG